PLLEKMKHTHDQNPTGEFGLFKRNGKRNAVIAGIALAATAVALWWPREPTGQPAVIGGRIRQITKTSGYDTEPAFSADGSQLAYASDREGRGILHIWTQPARGGKPRQLTTGPDDDHEPAFSPDGKTIAFRSARNGG